MFCPAIRSIEGLLGLELLDICTCTGEPSSVLRPGTYTGVFGVYRV